MRSIEVNIRSKFAVSVLMLSALGLAMDGCGEEQEFNSGKVEEKLVYPELVEGCDLSWLRPPRNTCKGEYHPERFAVKLKHCPTTEEKDCVIKEVPITKQTYRSLQVGQYVTLKPQENK